ncbi:MucR family transcriptional regulator [Rhizosaccharibacter radicis]|uniref:MucR family transcriptional regulator n=1 Tax=Rhizosaccharibacter radicis TaxID=2782605 RepID=A0ABT1VUB3_9PROT|nr:MucR family transcriptional regulator [Acetobacteraceae bacterium KSS12]
MSAEDDRPTLLALSAQIVSAHVSNNTVAFDALPYLIRQVHDALASAGQAPSELERPQPAVPVKKSVFPDYIVCLEDGKKLKMLKRHLQSAYNMTPEQYRERWNLPSDYPMVAPSYAERRSTLAREIGLGRKTGRVAAAAAQGAEDAAPATPARRGRRRNADKG